MLRSSIPALLVCASCGLPPGEHTSTTVESAITGSTYAVRTFVPEGAPKDAPLLVVLDGDWHAVPAFLEAADDAHEPVIVLSVGYEDGNERVRDYTPTTVAAYPDSGGLDAFARALEEEILPVAPGTSTERIWFGHSLGGVAVTYLWLQRPDLVSTAIVASPAAYWDDGLLIDMAATTSHDGEVFVSVGGQEGWGLPALASALAHELDAPFVEYPGREHTGTIAPSLRDGLLHLLERQ